jgi:hypothetical protein
MIRDGKSAGGPLSLPRERTSVQDGLTYLFFSLRRPNSIPFLWKMTTLVGIHQFVAWQSVGSTASKKFKIKFTFF